VPVLAPTLVTFCVIGFEGRSHVDIVMVSFLLVFSVTSDEMETLMFREERREVLVKL
jgi:hypothetical protein